MGVVSRRQVWLVGVDGIYGCGCKEVFIILYFLILLIPSCICSFLQQHPYFLFILLNVFLVPVLFVINPRRACAGGLR